MNPRILLTAAASTLVLAGCAVGPDYVAPSQRSTATGPFVASSPPVTSADQPAPGWWRLFEVPALDALVEQALIENRDIAVAAANLAQVRASLRESRTQRLPTTGLSAQGAAVRQINPLTGSPADGESYSVGLDVSYEVDFFGRVSRSIEAASADVDAAREALEVVRISVAGETARAFADACAANAQIDVAERSIRLQSDSLGLVQRQAEAGRGTQLDVARAATQLESQRAGLPPLQAQRDEALFRLAVLTGRPPAELSTEARACTTIPRVRQTIPVGDGASLLLRRPDVRQAERQLAAATARIGVATASLYPRVTLGGSLGTGGPDTGDVGSIFTYSVGPLISWSFPNIAAAKARIAQADAAAQGALARWEGVSLAALQETETALSAYARELDRVAALQRARDEGERATRLVQLRFDAGASTYLELLDAQRTQAQLEAQLIASQALVTTYQVNLFKALAGGWSPS